MQAEAGHESASDAEARLAREDARREEERRNACHRLLIDSGMPGDLYDANFVTRQDGEYLVVEEGNRIALLLCERLPAEWSAHHKGLTLSGPDAGCGKTYASAAVARALIDAGVRVQWTTASALLGLFRDSYGATWKGNPGVLSQHQVWHKYAVRPGLLVLDDLGAEKMASGEAGDWARERLLELVSHRSEGQKPTLVTTNLTEPQLRHRYGPRILSRLLSRSPLVGMAGPDFRRELRPGDDPFAD